MPPEPWTDERLDDLAEAMRPLPAQLARNTEAIDRCAEDIRAMRVDIAAMQRQMTRIGWSAAGLLAAQLVAIIALG